MAVNWANKKFENTMFLTCQEHGFFTLFQHFSLTHNPYLSSSYPIPLNSPHSFHSIPTAHSFRSQQKTNAHVILAVNVAWYKHTNKDDSGTTTDGPFHIPRRQGATSLQVPRNRDDLFLRRRSTRPVSRQGSHKGISFDHLQGNAQLKPIGRHSVGGTP
jgi:hypothetical protein